MRSFFYAIFAAPSAYGSKTTIFKYLLTVFSAFGMWLEFDRSRRRGNLDSSWGRPDITMNPCLSALGGIFRTPLLVPAKGTIRQPHVSNECFMRMPS